MVLQTSPCWQLPQDPPQPSSPQTLLPHAGAQSVWQ